MFQDEKAESLQAGAHTPRVESTRSVKSLEHQARKRIGTHLRAMYDSVVQQPVPSRFTDLIAQLDDTPIDQDAKDT